MKYQVIVVDKQTKEVVETLDCSGERDAQTVADGVRINLNHREFRVEIVCTKG
jgi:hypothetical protein